MRSPVAFAALVVLAVAGALGVAACGAPLAHVAALDAMERVRDGAGAQEGAVLAPEVYARAERERQLAIAAHDGGDDVAATLHAERAVAAYEHALVVARLTRASTELAGAQKAADDATAQAQTVEASRTSLEHDAQELEGRLRVARDRMMPASSGKTTPDREAARLQAARSMAVEAHLLCDAAALVSADAAGLADASGDLGKLDDRLAKNPGHSPIDDAARVRARCLDVLTRARRARGDEAGGADALLAELSASGGWDPARDERGVVVTLHDAFTGPSLSPDGAKKLQDLGHVASAHPAFAVQVVVHDAQQPLPQDTTDAKRADAAAQALIGAGAAQAHLKTELAGARAPIVDPRDAKTRGRNERLDVVFVASGK